MPSKGPFETSAGHLLQKCCYTHKFVNEPHWPSNFQTRVINDPQKFQSCRNTDVFQSSRYLTIEREVVSTAQVQSDLNKLSAEAAVEHSTILVDSCEDLEVVCARCLKNGNPTWTVFTSLYKLQLP